MAHNIPKPHECPLPIYTTATIANNNNKKHAIKTLNHEVFDNICSETAMIMNYQSLPQGAF